MTCCMMCCITCCRLMTCSDIATADVCKKCGSMIATTRLAAGEPAVAGQGAHLRARHKLMCVSCKDGSHVVCVRCVCVCRMSSVCVCVCRMLSVCVCVCVSHVVCVCVSHVVCVCVCVSHVVCVCVCVCVACRLRVCVACRLRQVSLFEWSFARRLVFAPHSRHGGGSVWMLTSACWQHSFCFPLSSGGACSDEHKRGLSSIAWRLWSVK